MRSLFLICVVCFSACDHDSKKSVTKKLDNPRRFAEGGVLMLMSGVFVRSTFSELADLWIRSGVPGESISKRTNDLQRQQTFEGPTFIFRDTTDVRNIFYFTEAPYLDAQEGMEEKMFSDFESVMTENCKKIGATCRSVENDFFSLSNGDKVFKMSYEVNYSADKEYSTTYFVASKTRIVMVVVHNISDDGEATVRTMNIDPYFYVDPLPAD
jgi:hypothetical protein